MKKLFAIVAVMGVLTFGSTQLVQAQDAAATEQAAPAADKPVADAVAEAAEASAPLAGAEEGGIHKEIKSKIHRRYCIFHEFGCYRIGYWFGFLY